MMSHRIVLSFLGALVAIFALGAGSRPPRAVSAPRENPEVFPEFRPFGFPAPPGERLRYDIRLRGLSAGYVTMTVAEVTDSAATVEYEMRTTNALLELIYPIRDRAMSVIATDGSYSLSYVIQSRQGRRHVDDAQRHDYEAGVARWTRERLSGDRPPSSGEVALPGPVQDPLSWFYYVRASLRSGERGASFAMLQRDSLWAVELDLELGPDGEPVVETLDLGELGEVEALRVAAGADLGGIFGEIGPEGGIWFDAATGILLRVQAATSAGWMEMTLGVVESD